MAGVKWQEVLGSLLAMQNHLPSQEDKRPLKLALSYKSRGTKRGHILPTFWGAEYQIIYGCETLGDVVF